MTTINSPEQDEKALQKAEKLGRLWNELLARSPTPDHFLKVAQESPILFERAWQAFADTQPSAERLSELMDEAKSYDVRRSSCMLFIERFAQKADLMELLTHDSSLNHLAAEKLLAGPLDNEELVKIIRVFAYDPDTKIHEKAADVLFTQSPEVSHLEVILQNTQEAAEKAADLLLQQDVSESVLLSIFCKFPKRAKVIWDKCIGNSTENFLRVFLVIPSEYSEQAAQIVLEKSGDVDLLLRVFTHHPDLRTQAWNKLKQLPLTQIELGRITQSAPSFKDEVAPFIKVPEVNADTICCQIRLTQHNDGDRLC